MVTRRANWLNHLPNALSAARIAACPVLVVLAYGLHAQAFTWLLVPALLSDVADGLIARVLHVQSQLGALLDSIGDTALLFTSIYGIWTLHPNVIRDHAMAGAIVIGLWIIEMIAAFLLYGRLSSFHTYLSKTAGYLLGIFMGVLFVFGLQNWLLYVAVAVSVAGNVEELLLLGLLPEWRSDVRGVYWVLRERRRAVATS